MAFTPFEDVPPAVMTFEAGSVTATRATLRADLVGTVNGAGGFAFTLWASDGTTDTLRMRIWSESGGIETVLFDNGFGQPIGGGSIVIHKAK